MNKYELVIIVDAKLNDAEKERITKSAAELIVKGGGKTINSQIWIEKQKFSFKIKKCTEGTYYLINFESPAGAISKIKQGLTLNEEILRFAITRAQQG